MSPSVDDVARFSFSELLGNSLAVNVTKSCRGVSQKASAYRGVMCMLPPIADRLTQVQIEQKDFRALIQMHDARRTFFYLDPYVPTTRLGGKYRCEMS